MVRHAQLFSAEIHMFGNKGVVRAQGNKECALTIVNKVGWGFPQNKKDEFSPPFFLTQQYPILVESIWPELNNLQSESKNIS